VRGGDKLLRLCGTPTAILRGGLAEARAGAAADVMPLALTFRHFDLGATLQIRLPVLLARAGSIVALSMRKICLLGDGRDWCHDIAGDTAGG